MGKAPKGDGYPRKQGGAWVQWLDLGRDDAGRRIRKKVTGQSRDEVRTKIRALRAKHAAGVDVRKKAGTVADLVTKYLNTADVRPRTLATYRYLCERFIVPHLGARPVSKVTPSDLQEFLTKIAKEPRKLRGKRKQPEGAAPVPIASGTIGLVRTVLIRVFDLAVLDRVIADNTAKRTRSIRIEEKTRQALTDAQADALIQALHGDRLEVAVRLLLSLGLRRGECAALKLDDLDLDAKTLTIDETSGYVPGVGLHTGPTKTKASARVIALPGRIAALLAWYLRQRETEQRAMNWKDSPWLFRSIDGGRQLNPTALYGAFQRAARSAGLVGFSPHSLRHSAGTFMKSEGIPLKEIATILGHGSMAELDRYLHTLPGEQAAAIEKLDARLARSAEKRRTSGE